jgi:hypothetical protein
MNWKRTESEVVPVDDELYRLVADAENSVHRLTVNLHYRTVECR